MMPGLAHRNGRYSFGLRSKNRDDVTYNQLQKFWSELSPTARQELFRIDKQTLFEQARKNMYCSRCNGLLLECFLQIVMYGKSLQQDVSIRNTPFNRSADSENQYDYDSVVSNGCPDEMQDPAVHPWGGLTTRRDGSLTLLDCYLYAKSLKGLQNVFDGARSRERERELLYPDACGGGGRGWISQGMTSYGRGHGTRETCALHTARLSCDTLVDFWSALGEETRQSLLRMKEEDFIERLMYRFDSKRFCRDCRRNVIREFKDLKELKRMRREPRCTTWFCAADTAFQYEVSVDTVQADWRQTFSETAGTYHHFEWAIGTGEGKSDLLEFENVGMSRSVQVSGLDLGGLSACYITLRAFKLDGRCTEISVKAHALKGQQCVHCRLVVGDGYVSIKRGESIRRFFEHAEEAEEEEDEDLTDKDGNELDGDCSRPQKHAKSPELAREFLLDAATVIFKEQVEKAFREGTARQNAHSIFVCLTLTLLEERVHVACKEIITLEKQMKLLEEEEREKREEEERKERKRAKEREKKIRRKERLKEKERGKEKKNPESNDFHVPTHIAKEESLPNNDEEPSNAISCEDSVNETGNVDLFPPDSSATFSDDCPIPRAEINSYDDRDGEVIKLEAEKGAFITEQLKPAHQRAKYWKEFQPDPPMNWSNRRRYSEDVPFVGRSEARYRNDRFEVASNCFNGSHRQLRAKVSKCNSPDAIKCNERFPCSGNRKGERHDFHPCSCKQHNEYRAKVEPKVSATTKGTREPTKSLCKSDSAVDISKPAFRSNRDNQTDYNREARPKGKPALGQNSITQDSLNSNKVWEPMESKKYPWSKSDSDVTLTPLAFKAEGIEFVSNVVKPSYDVSPCEATGNPGDIVPGDNNNKNSSGSIDSTEKDVQNEVHEEAKNHWHSSDPMMSSSSSSDNCSSCLSGDSSNNGNTESSSTSDSEDASQQSEGRGDSVCAQNRFSELHEKKMETSQSTSAKELLGCRNLSGLQTNDGETKLSRDSFTIHGHTNQDNVEAAVSSDSQNQGIFSPMLSQNIQFPMFQAPAVGYYHQSPAPWPGTPATGLTPFPHPNQYLYTTPLGYGLNGDSHLCMQYGGPLNPSATPFFNSGPIPVLHPFAKANGVNMEERVQILEPQAAHSPPSEAEAGKAKAPSSDKTVKSVGTENSFSLFHFGGPVALSSGCKSNPLLCKDSIVGDFSSGIPTDHVVDDIAGNKKEKENTYNLFAASNGLRFSFF